MNDPTSNVPAREGAGPPHGDAREAAKALEKRLGDITHSLPGVVFQISLIDGRHRMTMASDGALAMFGRTPRQMEDDAESLLGQIHPEDRAQVTQCFADSEKTSCKIHATYRYRAPDASWRWAQTDATPVRDASGGLVWNGYTMDVTELREAQQRADEAEGRIRDITESLPGLVYEMEFHPKTGSRMVFVTEGSLELYGISREEVLADTTALTRLIPLEDRAKMLQEFAKSLGQMAPTTQDFRIVRRDGETRWLRTHSARRLAEGGVMRWIGHTVDVTEAKVIEHELAKAKSDAEAANRAKSDFLANMSHEIRTPMNAIIGLAQLVLRTGLDGMQRDYLEKIHASSHALLSIINDILDFSKIEAGKLSLERTAFDLGETLDNVTSLIGMKAEEKKLAFEVMVDNDVPMHLLGDPLRLGQVLLNLVGNAVKFTEKGGVTVTVRRATATIVNNGGAAAPPGDFLLEFAVRDTGIGLDTDSVRNLFRPFTQADASTTRRYGGSGLGLSISRQLVNLMGGDIFVESRPGLGSTFSFAARFGKAEAPAAKSGEAAPTRLKALRVLIVDDSKDARDILRAQLGSFGCEVHESGSGGESVELVRDAMRIRPFDLVLMDWQMPDMNGINASRLIRTLGPGAPRILMISGYGRPELRRQVEELGLEGLLLKPVDASLLHNHLTQMFREQAPATAPVVAGSPEAAVAGLRVLVAEDHPINQQVARGLLQGAGVKVEIVADGKAALDAVRGSTFDAVLMDVQMPVMDGLAATREIRKDSRFARLPIVAMTANAMAADRERCLAAGMNDHVPKPIDVKVLLRTLARAVGEARAAPAPVPVTVPPEPLAVPLPVVDGFDLPLALERFGSQREILEDVVHGFLGEADAMHGLLNLLSQGDRDGAIRSAHSMKGMAATLGCEALRAAAAELETTLREQQPFDASAGRLALMYADARRRLGAAFAR